jgi:hypothetical protein
MRNGIMHSFVQTFREFSFGKIKPKLLHLDDLAMRIVRIDKRDYGVHKLAKTIPNFGRNRV